MPNNVFTITISATDKATATIRKINDSMSKITRPFEEVGKSFKSLGREIGIDKIGKNLAKIGATARTASRGVGSIVAPLAGISGIATVAGIVHLADSWGSLGRSITYASQNIGVSTTQLQAFQGAARMAGLSGEAMTQSLQGLGNTMEDALFGRNQQALMLFNRLGVGIKRTKTGAMDVTAEYDALGKAIYKLDTPQKQWLAASQFGLTAMLPLIRKYRGDMKKAREEAEKQGIVMSPAQIASANAYANAMSKLSLQGSVLKNTIGNALIPALTPLIEQLTNWVSQNRELIGTKVTAWARELGHWISSIDWKGIGNDIHAFIKNIQSVVNFLGGWKNAAIAVVAVLNAGLIANVVSLGVNLVKLGGYLGASALKLGKWTLAAKEAGGAAGLLGKAGGVAAAGAAGWAVGSFINKHFVEGTKFGDALGAGEAHIMALLGSSAAKEAIAQSRAHADNVHTAAWYRQRQLANPKRAEDVKSAMAFFMSKGWSKAQAAGIVANIATESNFRTDAVGDRGKAYGLGQWHPDRQAQFQKVEGVDIRHSTLQQQMDFYNWELLHTQKRAGDLLRNSGNAFASGGVVSAFDERPADVQGNIMSRGKLAQDIYNTYEAAPGPYTAGAGKSKDGKVQVEVAVKGLPPGTTAKVSTSGATTGNARVVHTTVGAMA